MTRLGSEGIAGLKFEICMIMTGILREFEVFPFEGVFRAESLSIEYH